MITRLHEHTRARTRAWHLVDHLCRHVGQQLLLLDEHPAQRRLDRGGQARCYRQTDRQTDGQTGRQTDAYMRIEELDTNGLRRSWTTRMHACMGNRSETCAHVFRHVCVHASLHVNKSAGTAGLVGRVSPGEHAASWMHPRIGSPTGRPSLQTDRQTNTNPHVNGKFLIYIMAQPYRRDTPRVCDWSGLVVCVCVWTGRW